MITALIVEDNPHAAQNLALMLQKHNNIQLVATATNLEEGDSLARQHRPALLFIDVELPDGSGIDFWTQLRSTSDWVMHAIFHTAFDHYAVSALRAQAHDYLVKPVTEEDLDAALHRFYTLCAEEYVGSSSPKTPSSPPVSPPLMVLDSQNHRVIIRPSDICFFNYVSSRKIWEVFCIDGNNYILRHGVNAGSLLQISDAFVQVHKSYIINISYVARIENSHILLLPPYQDNLDIQIGKNYRNDLFDRFCQL